MVSPDWPGLCKDAAAAAFFSVAIAMMYTAPLRALLPTLAAGFAGSFVRDLSIACHLGANWSTLLGATAVVLMAVTTARGNRLSPVVLISAVLPLGGASAMFELIFSVMKASVAEGEALAGASLAMTEHFAKVFIVSVAIASGIAVGISILRLCRWHGTVG